jgi:hypothetical protein
LAVAVAVAAQADAASLRVDDVPEELAPSDEPDEPDDPDEPELSDDPELDGDDAALSLLDPLPLRLDPLAARLSVR